MTYFRTKFSFVYQSEIDLSQEDILIQEFISDQLLIYGHTFNTGVRVIITSLKPLRAYYMKTYFAHRVASKKFNATDLSDIMTYVTDGNHSIYDVCEVSNLPKNKQIITNK